MQHVVLLFLIASAGCVGNATSTDASVQQMLARGSYRQAIVAIEHGPQSADRRFILGLLYAYREIEERGARADFTMAIQGIRAAAPENEEAQHLLSDYHQRGAQVFFAFPWAHMIGPFPEVRRPKLKEKA